MQYGSFPSGLPKPPIVDMEPEEPDEIANDNKGRNRDYGGAAKTGGGGGGMSAAVGKIVLIIKEHACNWAEVLQDPTFFFRNVFSLQHSYRTVVSITQMSNFELE